MAHLRNSENSGLDRSFSLDRGAEPGLIKTTRAAGAQKQTQQAVRYIRVILLKVKVTWVPVFGLLRNYKSRIQEYVHEFFLFYSKAFL